MRCASTTSAVTAMTSATYAGLGASWIEAAAQTAHMSQVTAWRGLVVRTVEAAAPVG